MRYNRRNPVSLFRLFVTDTICYGIRFFFKREVLSPKVKSVLLVNQFHQGDVVISTALVRVLAEKFGDIKCGMLVGSWSAVFLKGNPYIKNIHVIDHPFLNRKKIPFFLKWYAYFRKSLIAISEIRKSKYDVAFVLNDHEPSFILHLKLAGVGCVVGATGAGYGPLLSHVVDLPRGELHEVERQATVMSGILGPPNPRNFYQPLLVVPSEQQNERFGELIGSVERGHSPYVVLHPGSGNPAKEWSTDNWVQLALKLSSAGYVIWVCGLGEREEELAAKICARSMAQSLVSKLSWPQYVSLLSRARGFFGVDSVAGHVAASVAVPGVIVSNGIAERNRWTPLSEHIISLVEPMACSPCHSRPCATRDCIMSISPDKVFAAFMSVSAFAGSTTR